MLPMILGIKSNITPSLIVALEMVRVTLLLTISTVAIRRKKV
jgi:hypothetical protein